MAAFDNDLAKHYDLKPIIVIHEKDQRDAIIHLLKASKYRHAEGTKDNVLHEVRSWDYGVLMLSAEEGTGVDARFRRDAISLVLAEVRSYHELQQMVGRSSRSRGVCEGVLYLIGEERPA